MTPFKIFSVGEDELTEKICKVLDTEKGTLRIDTFSDGEFSPQYMDTIRNQTVFLVCSTNTPEKILKLFLAIDAAKRASVEKIVVLLGYYGYGRQDRREGARGPIGARTMADLLIAVGANSIITADLHAAQIQGFFDIPVDHINGYKIFAEYLKKLPAGKYCVCSPDAGGVKRATSMYKKFMDMTETNSEFDITFAMMSKRREKPNSIESMELIGEVEGRTVLLVDDMADTAGTLLKAATILKEKGAIGVKAIITHGVLSGDAITRVIENKDLDSLVISDSIQHIDRNMKSLEPKIVVVSCAKTFARAIRSIADGQSMEKMLDKS